MSWAGRLLDGFHRRLSLARLMKRADHRALQACRERHRDDGEAHASKYWDLRRQIAKNLHRAHLLGLHRQPARRVLDLGTGFGYFPFVCELYGHEVLALDVETDVLLYREVTEILGVTRRLWTIRADRPLPDLGRRFDLVTAFAVLFDLDEDGRRWEAVEWLQLLRDLAHRHLTPTGRIFLALNKDHRGRHCGPQLERALRAHGAEVEGPTVYFPSVAGLREATTVPRS